MSQIVSVDVQVRLTIRVDEDQPVNEVLHNMDYNFSSQTLKATIVESEIVGWNVVESK